MVIISTLSDGGGAKERCVVIIEWVGVVIISTVSDWGGLG